MATTQQTSSPRWILIVGWLWSVIILGVGLVVSLATGEWIALLCAAGLVILPIGSLLFRARRMPR